MSDIAPFRIDVPQAQLDDLRDRLARTRWPSEIPGAGWRSGPPVAHVRALVERWRDGYDWRAHEARLNAVPQFVTTVDGQRLHFQHARAGDASATPLLLLHGWPGSFVEFSRVVAPLAERFHVVVPSLPGFGFSGPTADAGWTNGRVAAALLALMTRLGYERFGVHGTDAGALIAPEIARLAPTRVVGVHVSAATLGFIPLGPVDPADVATMTDAERARLGRLGQFMAERFGFNAIQSMRPQAVAFALADSPAGLLAWTDELFAGFGDTPDAVDADTVLTNATIYWVTDTIASSMRLYHENARDPGAWAAKANAGVPTAVTVFRDDVAIRRFAEAQHTIVRWTEHDLGGHFAALERPELVVDDLRAFFATAPAAR